MPHFDETAIVYQFHAIVLVLVMLFRVRQWKRNGRALLSALVAVVATLPAAQGSSRALCARFSRVNDQTTTTNQSGALLLVLRLKYYVATFGVAGTANADAEAVRLAALSYFVACLLGPLALSLAPNCSLSQSHAHTHACMFLQQPMRQCLSRRCRWFVSRR